jgi:hypothetical protein
VDIKIFDCCNTNNISSRPRAYAKIEHRAFPRTPRIKFRSSCAHVSALLSVPVFFQSFEAPASGTVAAHTEHHLEGCIGPLLQFGAAKLLTMLEFRISCSPLPGIYISLMARSAYARAFSSP